MNFISYQLTMKISEPVSLKVGSLGFLAFKPGIYVYTGSAKKNINSRIRRHLKKEKKKHWHIDYLTSHPAIIIIEVKRSETEECELNRQSKGKISHPGFGATDCQQACGSHLKYIGLNL